MNEFKLKISLIFYHPQLYFCNIWELSNGRTNQLTDQWTDKAPYRDTWMNLKILVQSSIEIIIMCINRYNKYKWLSNQYWQFRQFLAIFAYFLYFLDFLGEGGEQGSGPDIGPSPGEWRDFLNICSSVRPSIHPSVLPSIPLQGHTAKLEPLGWLAWPSDFAGWASGLAGWTSGLAGWVSGLAGWASGLADWASGHAG